MELVQLSEKNLQSLSDKRIYCFEKSMQYLEEMLSKWEIAELLQGIIDVSVRQQGSFLLHDRQIPVKDISFLEKIDWSQSVLVITSDYYREAFELLESRISDKFHPEKVYYYLNWESVLQESYREQLQNSELENIIIFRSGPHASSYVKGMDFSDNARALFEYMLKEKYNEKYKLVWIVNEPDEFLRYQDVDNVLFISWYWALSEQKEERDIYYKHLYLAKYIFFTDAYGFARNCRNNQIRVQLWHGCGFKTRVNFSRCEKRYEYTTVISELYAKIHSDIYGLRPEQMLVTGYAKTDCLFDESPRDIKSELRFPEGKKYIFWLPTFRTAQENLSLLNEKAICNETGFPILNSKEQLKQLDFCLKENQSVLVIKLHPFQNLHTIAMIECSNIVMLSNEQLYHMDIQTNEILMHADALISDYSSAAVDYLLLDRPIAFTLDDVDEYKQSRGFVFENISEWLPGKEIYTLEDFRAFIVEIASDIDSSKRKRSILRNKMHKYHEGFSCKRIIETLQI